MTHRVFRRAALAAVAALTAVCLAAPAGASSSALPKFDITGVYVTGVSSRGFMATQKQVAYYGAFDGAGIIAAGPYDCGQAIPVNPEGCWDWWGYDGPDFAVKTAPQMVTIMNMVAALGG